MFDLVHVAEIQRRDCSAPTVGSSAHISRLGDVDITIRVPDIAIPGEDYEDGPAQGLDKLDPHVISTWTTRKKTPIRILLGLL